MTVAQLKFTWINKTHKLLLLLSLTICNSEEASRNFTDMFDSIHISILKLVPVLDINHEPLLAALNLIYAQPFQFNSHPAQDARRINLAFTNFECQLWTCLPFFNKWTNPIKNHHEGNGLKQLCNQMLTPFLNYLQTDVCSTCKVITFQWTVKWMLLI